METKLEPQIVKIPKMTVAIIPAIVSMVVTSIIRSVMIMLTIPVVSVMLTVMFVLLETLVMRTVMTIVMVLSNMRFRSLVIIVYGTELTLCTFMTGIMRVIVCRVVLVRITVIFTFICITHCRVQDTASCQQ